MSRDAIDKLRKSIDSLDEDLLALLNRRAEVAKKIGQVKERRKADVFSVERERQILESLFVKNKGPLGEDEIDDIFQSIFTTCRSIQRKYSIAYFGPEATFTHQAALKHFGRNCAFIPLPSIKDVFFEVERKRADFGVVPIENSTEGVVNHSLDMFIDSDLLIVAEREEPISHNLFSLSGRLKEIQTVYSHPQPLAQCRKWLDTHLPHVAIHESASTSDAALKATLDASSGAIASLMAGKMYHLKPVAEKIEDTRDNATRFLIIGRASAPETGRDKTSILFALKDKVGALYEVLEAFKKEGLNLTKIESRPTKKKAWEYIFFVDFIGHQSQKNVQRALASLREKCSSLKILGSYPY